MADPPEPIDEWHRVGELLGDTYGLMASPTSLGRVLREAAILLADPEVDDETVEVFRKLATEFDRIASRH